MKKLLSVRDLCVTFGLRDQATEVVHNVSFDLAAGETLAIVGESGSGKSVTAMAINRLVDFGGGEINSGTVEYYKDSGISIDLTQAGESELESIRGREIGMIFQEPMTSLNPVLSIGRQLVEIFRVQQNLSRADAIKAAGDALQRVRIPDAYRRLSYAPHQLSGGMLQRVMIAMALASKPRLLIADEPTTALDVTIQAQIIGLLIEMQRETGAGLIFITHDIGLVAGFADRVMVMQRGEAVEQGTLDAVFDTPQHEYTRHLLRSVPHFSDGRSVRTTTARTDSHTKNNALKVANLTVRFPVQSGILRRVTGYVHAVENISFDLRQGETLGIVGESGSGKSTIARAVLDLVNRKDGDIQSGHNKGAAGRPLQMVFQNPNASLNPRLTVKRLLAEPIVASGQRVDKNIRERMHTMLERVGLPENCLTRFPYEFSGGQRQRLCIARALLLNPMVLVLDEAVSALDVSVQAHVLDLLIDLQEEFGIAYLFVSHDMAVIERIAHRIAVINAGRIVEIGRASEILSKPQHSYTRQLINAVPNIARRQQHFSVDLREMPSLVHPVGWESESVSWRTISEDHHCLQEN